MLSRRCKLRLSALLCVCGLTFTPVAVTRAQEAGRRTKPGTATPATTRQNARVRPPAAVTCDRNDLTSYTGKVLYYSRRNDRIVLRIKTDWDTTETVTLRSSKNADPSKWFLLRGETFQRSDWKKIESSRRRIIPGMRVSAWVCNDGRRPIIDWQPPTDDPPNKP